MKLQLLGTGSSDGWPNPWCSCASCNAARSAGELRSQTGVLVDDRLLIDCGPDVPRAAARFGVDLGTVELLLIGHAHPDHCGPQALMWRGWSSRSERPLEVIGPPAVIEACRPWADPAGPIAFTPIEAGGEMTRSGYRIRAHPARHGGPEIGPAVLFDVTGPDGTRLLYAVDTAPLEEDALPGDREQPYDVLLLENTFGDAVVRIGDHHGLDDFAATVSAMRRAGTLNVSSHVVAVHLGHGNPAGAQLHRRLALVGAVALPDGAVLETGGSAQPPSPVPRRVLITGGARSGKSQEAERRLAGAPEVVYVATAEEYPGDEEWSARLAAHRARRPAHWSTVETAVLAPLLREPGPPLLIDCLGLWLARESEDPDALVEAWRACQREVVLVTNEVGSGVVPATASGRTFRDGLGRLNARIAAESDEVWHCVAGVACRLK
ncbi:MAG TPA: bifunctional adenosylcobinamide kinase/adenosylcobinamide-phosphate guanylyltransferase [Frankiaceae bacterium]|nr:bifunctional adenosylcobinamide kinase/adenosylcobinamide-phosphate guanylyltransferase [Frankiaceae bacterium]